jgi:hypothetical protein
MPWAPSNKAQAASAIIAGLALIAVGFGGAIAWMSYHGSTTIAQLKAEAELKGSSDTLQRRFKDFGIDDVNALSDFSMRPFEGHRTGARRSQKPSQPECWHHVLS